TRALLMVALVAGMCGAAAAQGTSDPSFARMREKLKAGDRVTVQLADGRILEGRFSDVSAEALLISTTAGNKPVVAGDVARVQRHRRGVLLGTLIGAGVGIACGAAMSRWFEYEGHDGAGVFIGMTAIGIGAGVGIDALINIPRTVYRQIERRAGAQPESGGRRIAIAWRVTF
ncbi:MAG TPA: hypothetical protein VF147_08845, partial [Vicinamibacterales bacterium]